MRTKLTRHQGIKWGQRASADDFRLGRHTGKNPYEAAMTAVIRGRNPFKAVRELDALLNECRLAVKS